MREFKSAAKQAEDPEDVVRIKLDDVELVSLRPTEGQLVMLMAAEASETRSRDSQLATTIDFALSIFDDNTRRYLGSRLLDPQDPFSLSGGEDGEGAGLLDLIQAVVEEWTNRPTKPSSGSTSSPENGGSSSTDTASTAESTSLVSASPMPVT